MPRIIRLISCVGVRYDLAMLPHFLQHYLALGVAPQHIHVVLNARPADAEALAQAHEILATHGVAATEEWIAPYTSDSMWAKRREVQQRVAEASDWVLSADVDELQEYPTALPDFLDYCEQKGANCVQGVFIDRLAEGGHLVPIQSAPSIWEQFPVAADVACTIRRGQEGSYWYGTVNLMASRGGVLPSRGGHHPVNDGTPLYHVLGRRLAQFRGITRPAFRFALPLRVHHFKWVDTMQRSVKERLDTPGASAAGSAYGRRVLRYISQEGRINLDDVPVKESHLIDALPWRLRLNGLRLLARTHRLAHSIHPRLARWMP